MKKLDLSMIPIDLKVGEEMEVLTPKGDKVTVRCVEDEREEACETCIFGDNGLYLCSHVKCHETERETKDSVSFQEVKRERACIKRLEEEKEYKVGEVIRYFKGVLHFPKYAKVVESNRCYKCVLKEMRFCVKCGEKERKDGKSVELLPCNEKGELI